METREENSRKRFLKVVILTSVGLWKALSKTTKTHVQITHGVTDETDRWQGPHPTSAPSP